MNENEIPSHSAMDCYQDLKTLLTCAVESKTFFELLPQERANLVWRTLELMEDVRAVKKQAIAQD